MGMRTAAIAIACVGCGRIGFDPLRGSDGSGGPGDGAVDAFVDAAPLCTSFGPWSASTVVTELDTMGNNLSPDASPDDLVVFFESDRGAPRPSIYRADRAAIVQPFTNVGVFIPNDTAEYDDPVVAAHGTRLYYSRNDKTTAQVTAQVVTITGTTHTAPVTLPELGTQAFGLWVRDDELELWLGAPQMKRYRRASVADAFTAAPDGDPTELGIDASYPSLSRDELTVFFESGRGGRTQIWTATRASADQPFGTQVPAAALNDATFMTGDPSLSADALTIRFDLQGTAGFEIRQSTRMCLQ